MSGEGFDKDGNGSLHELVRQRGDGLLSEPAEALLQRSQESEVTKCKIITLVDLPERRSGTTYEMSNRASALVIDFPAPRWLRNANARS
jgi:hypothetical protein